MVSARSEHFVDGDTGVTDRLEALAGIFLEAPLHKDAHSRRNGGGKLCPIGMIFDDGGQSVGDGFAVESHFPGQHLVEDAAEGPDIRAAIGGFAASLLGRHVRGGSKDHASLRGQTAHRGRAGDIDGRDFVLERFR